MDFGRPLKAEESAASRSRVRHIPVEEAVATFCNDNPNDGDAEKELDRLAMAASNKAAKVLLTGPAVKPVTADNEEEEAGDENDSMMDSALYKYLSLPQQGCIQEGDLVVILISFGDLNFVYAKKNDIFNNRNGHFHHNDFLGKPFGCKVRSRNNQGFGFCYLLKPTPELWVRSLPHRTQIVHELDQSQIVYQLQLRPNMTVVESGTGSGAMSHAILRTIAPSGHLHTYEFSPSRAKTAREEFIRHGLGHLVTVYNKDVCCLENGGFERSQASVDAVFLDLPEPWNAVPYAAHVCKPNARIANYSPCIEQTQRAVAALEAAGFHSICTMEYRLQEYHVDVNVAYKPPPMDALRPCLLDSSYKPGYRRPKGDEDEDGGDWKEEDPDSLPAAAKKARTNEEGKADSEKVPDDTNNDPSILPKEDEDAMIVEGNGVASDASGGKVDIEGASESKVATTMTVARPFGLMRGHTAFLTFATAGLVPQPKPKPASSTEAEATK